MDLSPLQPVDYLIIGHITIDKIPDGLQLGGTAVYAGLTASAMGMRVGILTSWSNEISAELIRDIPIVNIPAEKSTTFENITSAQGRKQWLHHVASRLDYYQIPEAWRKPAIIHLAPVAQEVEPAVVRGFSDSLVGVTPQGWMRDWDKDGLVHAAEWPEARFVLERSTAAVISIADVDYDEAKIEEMSAACKILAVTEGEGGARLYWNGDVRRFRAPTVIEVDSTGAGDIFAASFFSRLYTTRDPWEAARFATQLSARSVTKYGFEGIPTREDIQECLVEVF